MKFPTIKRPAFTRKNAIKYLSLAAIIAGVFAILSLLSSGPAVRAAFLEFPEGQKRAISFEIAGETLDTMTGRERLDQMRDWLLFTSVSDAGLSAEDYNQSLFDLPAVRHGYLQPTANFEYGEMRSAYIGEGRIVALVPAGGDPKKRADQLGRIADLHRKNTGEMPQSLTVFEYAIAFDGDDPSGELTRRETIDARELFSAKYNYIETSISSLDDLTRFLGRIDDLVFARSDGSVLTLGGRKLQGETYRGIGVEEIAAIWQSEEKIQSQGNPLQQLIDRFNRKWASRMYYSESEKIQIDLDYQREEAELKKEINAAKRMGGGFANGSGFSLDPAYNYEGLEKAFKKLIAPACRSIAGDDKIREVGLALTEKQVDPLFDLLYEVSKTNGRMARGIEQFVRQFEFQAARYDGDLKGTETGMVLFYTDLLAKLWALDFLDRAPTSEVDDFRTLLNAEVSPIYEKELEELGHTRLWFGPQDRGFQVADKGESLLFAHTATRIYAASANSLQTGKESEPNAESAAVLGWWDSHYDEVARYEPQYQRLNQIMKWSLLIGWLNQNNHGASLKSLSGVSVKRENWFPDWARKNPDLRFPIGSDHCKPGLMIRDARSAPQVCFFPRGYQSSETEALPRLASRFYLRLGKPRSMAGGVSLAERSLFRSRAALSAETQVGGLLRRSNLKYDLGSGAQGIQTLEGAKYSFQSLPNRQSLMTASAKDGARLRGSFSEMAGTTKVERTVNNGAAGLQVTTQANGTEIGALRITQFRNGFQVGYASREMDAGHAFGRSISRGGKLDLETLTKDPRVVAASKIPNEDSFLFKLRDSNRWLKMAEEKTSTTRLEAGWDSRVASLDGRMRLRLRWFTEQEAKLALDAEYNRVASQAAEANRSLPDALRRGDLRGATEELLQAHAIAEGHFKMHYADGIRKANGLIAEGKYSEAVQSLSDLSAVHGQRPEINTLRGLAKLGDQSPRVAQAVSETMRGGTRSTADFFNEVNVRLARSGLPNDAKLSLVSDGNRVGLRYDLASPLQGKSATPTELHGRNAIVLVQDSPGLNNLNWSVNAERAAREAVSLGLGDLRRAALGDIAGFRPSQVYVQEARAATTTPSNSSTLYRPHYSYSSSSDPCAYLSEEEKRKCLVATRGAEVYVVTATEKGKI